MKVLLLAPQPFYQERGTPIAVDLVLRALSARGDQVDVLAYHEGEAVTYPGVQLHRITRPPFVRGVGPGPSWKKVVCDIWFFVAALRLARQTRYDLVHAVEESVAVARVIKRRYGVPYLYDMDSCLSEHLAGKYPALRWLARGLRGWESRAMREAELVVPVCDALAEIAQQAGARRVTVLRDVSLLSMNGRPSVDRSPRDPGLPSKGPIAMYIGNLERYQGIDLLLESIVIARRRVPAAQLVIIGGQPRTIGAYQHRADQLGLKGSVHFLGPRPVAQLARYVQAADVLVSPRLRGGNTPMKIYSYLDSGKAVLATALPTHTQVLTEQVAMLRAPIPEPFAEGLVRLLLDPSLRQRLGANGRRLVAERYSYPVFQAMLNQVYDDLKHRAIGEPQAPVSARAGGRALRAAFSALLLWVIVRTIDWHAVGLWLRRMDWRLGLAASGLFIVNRVLAAAEWRLLLRAKGIDFSFRRLLRVVWMSSFFGQFLPQGIGGDGVRLLGLKQGGTSTSDLASSVFMERITGAVSLGMLALFGAIWSYSRWGERAVALALIAPLGALLAVLAMLWTAPGDRMLTWVLARLGRLPGQRLLAQVHEAVKRYRHSPGPVVGSIALSGLSQIFRVLSVYLLAKAIGLSLLFGEALALVPTALFVGMLPISLSGVGLREGAFIVLLKPAGIDASGAFALSILSRLAAMASNVPGAVWFTMAGQRHA